MSSPRLILASASPRRRQLLTDAGYSFIVHPADIDEEDYPPGLAPPEVARELALKKAHRVAYRFGEDAVLAADTLVVFGDEIIGKPEDEDHARQILELLSGTTHIVITGVAVVHAAAKFERAHRVLSSVRMKNLTPGEIERYLATGEWQGKAGAYGIQDRDPFVTRTAGSRSNIVGLPLRATRAMLAEAGIHSQRARSAP